MRKFHGCGPWRNSNWTLPNSSKAPQVAGMEKVQYVTLCLDSRIFLAVRKMTAQRARPTDLKDGNSPAPGRQQPPRGCRTREKKEEKNSCSANPHFSVSGDSPDPTGRRHRSRSGREVGHRPMARSTSDRSFRFRR